MICVKSSLKVMSPFSSIFSSQPPRRIFTRISSSLTVTELEPRPPFTFQSHPWIAASAAARTAKELAASSGPVPTWGVTPGGASTDCARRPATPRSNSVGPGAAAATGITTTAAAIHANSRDPHPTAVRARPPSSSACTRPPSWDERAIGTVNRVAARLTRSERAISTRCAA